MGKWGTAIVALCAGAALFGCGDSEETRSDAIGGADWTLTITSPQHGSLQRGRAMVRVAVTGPAVARGESPDFEIGYFVDGQLKTRSHDPEVMLAMPEGSYALRVDGIDAGGKVLPNVVGDEVMIEMGGPLDQGNVHLPSNRPEIPVNRGPNVRVGRPGAPGVNVGGPRL